ncbi:putative arylsulfatase regulatory protein [Vibrio ichthyoenteri ATCC 700023]|uniref:Putative arylsulfatase regulatory protein n=1 Tax=Vibrio ichthyoenteri ATCC 700023 TaxID=870968 RepID=F9S1U5_9VIBR|nr:hypothetical protein [Vibrio ichthyoenteri]EGU41185.1 putative arylsulfatase regulatory protein [Vibrio ichthyoenteri ATCC 700023]
MVYLYFTAEQQQLVQLVDEFGRRYPFTIEGDEQFLVQCYDYMDAFKRVMDSSTKVQMDYFLTQYEGVYRFANMMERLAEGIASGVITVPRDH